MATRTIKDVDDETWRKLKMLSAEHDSTMGKIIKKITEDYEERNRRFWDDILNSEKILSDKEADEIESFVRTLRKEKGFR